MEQLTKEQLAIKHGYVPDENGNIVSPRSGNFLKPTLTGNKGQKKPMFKFREVDAKKLIYVYVPRVVWTHFNGAIPDNGYIINKDGNPLNNKRDNLMLGIK